MDIPLSSDALDLTFHPSSSTNLLAVGLISGKIQLIDYSDYLSSPSSSRTPAQPPLKRFKTTSSPLTSETSPTPKLYRKVYTSRPSKKSCRGLHFSTTGTSIFSVSKDKSLYSTDTETGKVVQSWDEVHEAAPSRVLPVDENLVVTGDDEGVVRLWDVRKESGRGVKPVRQWEHHFDWITDMVYLPELPVPKRERKNEVKKSKLQLKKQRRRERQAALLKEQSAKNDDDDDDDSDDDSDEPDKVESRSRLIVTSGDGSLSSIDLLTSGPTSFEQSEDQEDELLSITSIRSSTKLVVGTQLGILSLWTPSRGLLDHVDRVPGHPASVDTLVTLDSETVLTGSSDGLVRVVQILPSKLLGVIASHDGLPVERMKRKESVLASIGHSNSVKLTDLTPLLEDEEDGDSEGEGSALGIVGLASDDQDSDDEEDDEEEEQDGDEQDDVVVGLDQDDQDDDDDDDDVEEGDQDSDSEDVAPSKKKAAKGGFFSDL
ncbi:WD repeat-containing protein [Pseudozyma hubeiensis SY62]|uniref:WD repeat-containing protein JIP5 n=1 Tax=Pseudozyma hubeiensis (strain SY62) TaxID=1305764 RepID=R9P8F1_PSEHS|nr:WD repeat-containing protein [Pseudozyma hubeiensis SY62]GAC97651.1 WD repeat-containing protein [Pseudozyma hubeiensis SY62]